VIKKIIKALYDVLGLPYYVVLNILKGLWIGLKKSYKGFAISIKWSFNNVVKAIKSIPKLLKMFGKWLIDAVKESIAQIFTLLGFFIAWFTLTGTAQDIVGIAIVVSTAIWLLTIRLRD